MQDQRYDNLKNWLDQIFLNQSFSIQKLAGDASFRRYFRVKIGDQSFVAMDAPPEKENCKPFIAIANAFLKLGIKVPEIIATQLDHGFILLSDLGDNLYLHLLNDARADQLYQQALDALLKIQYCREIADWSLPHFDETLLLKEWNLFYEWTVRQHWQAQLSHVDQTLLSDTFAFLQKEFLAQPKICVHRDYHSRNLLALPDNQVGVLDFQDAVWGPVTYDLLSLVRDCYITWPQQRVNKWVLLNYNQMCENGLLKNTSSEQFIRWFDLLGVQRHLKCLGIFARLKHLYEKPSYEKNIAPTLNYILQVSEDYPELKKFKNFLKNYAELQ